MATATRLTESGSEQARTGFSLAEQLAATQAQVAALLAAQAPAAEVSATDTRSAHHTSKPVTPKGSRAYRAQVSFAHNAIRVLRQAESNKSKGVHSVYSGFNGALKAEFALASEDLYALVDAMTAAGDIQAHWCKGGKMIYLPGEMPVQAARTGVSKATLDAIRSFKG